MRHAWFASAAGARGEIPPRGEGSWKLPNQSPSSKANARDEWRGKLDNLWVDGWWNTCVSVSGPSDEKPRADIIGWVYRIGKKNQNRNTGNQCEQGEWIDQEKRSRDNTKIEFGRVTTYIPSRPSTLIGTECHKPMNTIYATGTIINDQSSPTTMVDLPLTQLFMQCTSNHSFM